MPSTSTTKLSNINGQQLSLLADAEWARLALPIQESRPGSLTASNLVFNSSPYLVTRFVTHHSLQKFRCDESRILTIG